MNTKGRLRYVCSRTGEGEILALPQPENFACEAAFKRHGQVTRSRWRANRGEQRLDATLFFLLPPCSSGCGERKNEGGGLIDSLPTLEACSRTTDSTKSCENFARVGSYRVTTRTHTHPRGFFSSRASITVCLPLSANYRVACYVTRTCAILI